MFDFYKVSVKISHSFTDNHDSASVTFSSAGWLHSSEEIERRLLVSAARYAELRREAKKEREEDDARKRKYALLSADIFGLDEDITQWVVELVPISEGEAEEQFYRRGIDITNARALYAMTTPADPEEYDNTRGTITLRESRRNATKYATLGRIGLELQSDLISREICVVSLTALVFGSGSSESVGCTLNISMKKAPHEHAVYVNGRHLDMEVGVEKPLFGGIISFFGPTRFAYRVKISRETI